MINKLLLVALFPLTLFSAPAGTLVVCGGGGVGRTIKIVAIGDSITHGGDAKNVDEWTYRLPLQRKLLENGISFDFVGTRTMGLSAGVAWPDPIPGIAFDPQHEAQYGAKTAVARNFLITDLPNFDPADVALIHLGTNDQNAHLDGGIGYTAAIVDPLREIIGMLRQRNPNVIILLGHLNFNGGKWNDIRALVEQLAVQEHTESSPVVTVHHYVGFIADPTHPNTDTYDWAHPNPRGQEKMAQHWFNALLPYLGVPDSIAISTNSLPGAVEGQAYSHSMVASSGTAPLSWSISSGSLPSGLSLSTAGVISGTPAANTSLTSPFSVGIRVTDSSNPADADSKNFTLAVSAAAGGGSVESFVIYDGTSTFVDFTNNATAAQTNAVGNPAGSLNFRTTAAYGNAQFASNAAGYFVTPNNVNFSGQFTFDYMIPGGSTHNRLADFRLKVLWPDIGIPGTVLDLTSGITLIADGTWRTATFTASGWATGFSGRFGTGANQIDPSVPHRFYITLQAGDPGLNMHIDNVTVPINGSVDLFTAYLVAAGVPAGARGPYDDPEGDGIVNLLEYLYQTNPRLPNPLPQLQIVDDNGAPAIVTPPMVDDPSLVITVDFSENLLTWVSGQPHLTITSEPAGPGMVIYTAVYQYPWASVVHAFGRLSVRLAP